VVELKVKAGGAEQMIAAFGEAVELVRKEEGCLRYELNQDAADANVFVVYERWGSIAKLEAHLGQPHTKALLDKVMPLLEGEPKIRVMVPKADPVKPKKAEVK
jgi:quinol monooxygenase YgiN